MQDQSKIQEMLYWCSIAFVAFLLLAVASAWIGVFCGLLQIIMLYSSTESCSDEILNFYRALYTMANKILWYI